LGEIKMINNNPRIFYAVGELLAAIPKKRLSVNVGINVVGDRRKRLSRAGVSERIANGVVN
jgi:hypothetical protein